MTASLRLVPDEPDRAVPEVIMPSLGGVQTTGQLNLQVLSVSWSAILVALVVFHVFTGVSVVPVADLVLQASVADVDEPTLVWWRRGRC